MCHELIANMEMVMKPTPEHFCHLSCFRCVTCHRQLRTGDLYSVNPDHGWPYCQNHTMDAIPQRSHPFTAAAHHLQVLNSMGSNHAGKLINIVLLSPLLSVLLHNSHCFITVSQLAFCNGVS